MGMPALPACTVISPEGAGDATRVAASDPPGDGMGQEEEKEGIEQ
jgi:hypothetical protein